MQSIGPAVTLLLLAPIISEGVGRPPPLSIDWIGKAILNVAALAWILSLRPK